jgi:hypothetical protein
LIAVRVDDSASGMRRFTTKLEVSTWLQIELRTRGRQLTNTRGTFLDEDLDSFCVSEGSARGQGVLPVQLGRISGAKRRRDPALSVCSRAIEQRPLGQHHHVAVSGRAPCGVETSNSASHHEKARTYSADHALKSMRDVMCLKGADHSFFALNKHRLLVLHTVVFWAILLFR